MNKIENMMKFKVGDLVDTIWGEGVVTGIDTDPENDYPIKVTISKNNDLRHFTHDGKKFPHECYPSMWHKETGTPPSIGERPKWKPEKPTWAFVWNAFEENRVIQLVVSCDKWGYRAAEVGDRKLMRTTSYWKNAEPLSDSEIPDWWPEEWR